MSSTYVGECLVLNNDVGKCLVTSSERERERESERKNLLFIKYNQLTQSRYDPDRAAEPFFQSMQKRQKELWEDGTRLSLNFYSIKCQN